MIAYLFPGQGAQFVGMGKDLFDKYKEYTEAADDVLGYSIKELCLNDKDKVLGLTQYTQPALYFVDSLYYLQELENGIVPEYVAGHSLGEYNALFASGVFDLIDGLKLVKKRGELMGKVSGGKMLAVKDLPSEEIRKVLDEAGLNGIDIANLNTPSQIIISGLADDIVRSEPYLKKAGGITIPLNVSGAFHSRYMEPVASEFADFIKDFKLNEMKIPVVSNYTARVHSQEEIKDNLVKQIYSPVKWVESVRYMWGKGVEEFKQIGVGRVVINMANKIMKESEPLIVDEKVTSIQNINNDITENSEIKDIDVNFEEYEGKLGDREFMKKYNINLPYIVGPMHKGVSGYEFVKRLSDNNILSFVGTRGLSVDETQKIVVKLRGRKNYGVSVDYDSFDKEHEKQIFELLIREKISVIQASSYFNLTENLVLYKLYGAKKNSNGENCIPNKIFLKTTRPEIAELFMTPVPENMLKKMHDEGKLSEEQVEIAKSIPLADEIIVVSFGADKTGSIPVNSFLPQVIAKKNALIKKYGYSENIHVGAAGSIGDPVSALDAFLLGADFIMTGSVNQCTAEAEISDMIKNKLQKVEIQDTEIIPTSHVYEIGMKMQVLKKGVFFTARALKLYEIYNKISKIEDIEPELLAQIQDKYFGKSIDAIYSEIKNELSEKEIDRAETDSKFKFGLIIYWYYNYCTECAIRNDNVQNLNCLIPVSCAMGRINNFLEKTEYSDWKNRHPDIIAKLIMSGAEEKLDNILKKYSNISM